MDLKDILSKTETNPSEMLSEIIETQCMIKSMLSVIITEISEGKPEKESALVALVNELKDQELLRVVARFSKDD